jgi:hypothetical protein
MQVLLDGDDADSHRHVPSGCQRTTRRSIRFSRNPIDQGLYNRHFW